MKSQRKKRLAQANVKRNIQVSLMPENPTSGWHWPRKHFKSLKTTAKLSQVKSTNILKETNSKFYSLIENLIQSPTESSLSHQAILQRGFPHRNYAKEAGASEGNSKPRQHR